jgi:hypothetical protein
LAALGLLNRSRARRQPTAATINIKTVATLIPLFVTFHSV